MENEEKFNPWSATEESAEQINACENDMKADAQDADCVNEVKAEEANPSSTQSEENPQDATCGSEQANENQAPTQIEKNGQNVEMCQCEASNKETAPVQEEKPIVSFDEYKELTNAHFQNLRSLIKYTKTKDETIFKMNGELQKYREGYCTKAFKSIATLIISYREDCRKALEDLEKYDNDVQKVQKYIYFLVDDYNELLSNAGIENDGEVWRFNGKALSFNGRRYVKFPSAFQDAPELVENEVQLDAEGLKEYLKAFEQNVKALLANNEMLDKNVNEYLKLSLAIENDVILTGFYPALKKMISVADKIAELAEATAKSVTEENKNDKYALCLNYLIDSLEDVLLIGGVSIYTTVDDVFDTRKNRLVKAIVTTDKSLDRIIAKQYTECYMMNDAVIYPAKVDVYKYQEKN